MFDIGFPELVLIAIVALLVLGPERLPEALRTTGLWLGRMRRSFTAVKNEIEKEIGMDEIRRQLHNEAVLEEMRRIEQEVKQTAKDATIHPGPKAVADASSSAPDASGTGAQEKPDPETPVAEEPPGTAAAPAQRSTVDRE
ncbi:MAG: Sec-independent protein translocase protein TatB [Pseudomonadales bacterium]